MTIIPVLVVLGFQCVCVLWLMCVFGNEEHKWLRLIHKFPWDQFGSVHDAKPLPWITFNFWCSSESPACFNILLWKWMPLTWTTKSAVYMHDRHLAADYIQKEAWKTQQEQPNLFWIRRSPVRAINLNVFLICLSSTWHAYVNETSHIGLLHIFPPGLRRQTYCSHTRQ